MNQDPSPMQNPLPPDLRRKSFTLKPPAKAASASLQSRLALAFALLGATVSIVIITIVYFYLSNLMIQDVRDRLRSAVSLAVLTVNGDLHATLRQPDQQDSADYTTLKTQLQIIRDSDPEFYYVYTMRTVGEQVIFVVDAETDPEDMSPLGMVYDDIDPVIKASIDRMTSPVVDEGFYTDRWGTFISGYAPVYTSDGRQDAVLGIDINIQTVLDRQREILAIALAVLVVSIILSGISGYVLGFVLSRPLRALTLSAAKLGSGDLDYRIEPEGWREVTLLGEDFNRMAEQLAAQVRTLENRILERTRQSEQRSAYLTAAADVAAAAGAFLDPSRLTAQVVDLIRQRFDLYYVGIFLLDESGELAVLRAGTGSAGQAMIARGHRIHVGEGMIGWSIANAQPRIALDAGEDQQRLVNPLLPDTRSEAAIPLRSRGRVLGALTVQSSIAGAFDQALLATLQTMADQIAVSLDNARLISESQHSLEALQRSYQQLTQSAWAEFLRQSGVIAYRSDDRGVTSLQGEIQQEALAVTAEISLPIVIRGQELGWLHAAKGSEWSSGETDLLRSLLEQTGTALDNARLYSATQRGAERERRLSEITGRLRASTNVESILQTAVQELAQALNAPRAAIRLGSEDDSPGNSGSSQPPAPSSDDADNEKRGEEGDPSSGEHHE